MARVGKEQLIKLQKRYKTDAAIARIYGITRQAIAQQRKRYGIGIASDKFSKRNDEIIILWKKGISVNKLSVKFRFSRVHIYRIINIYKENNGNSNV